jgi:L-threonylcarbamoyladenylate synthase
VGGVAQAIAGLCAGEPVILPTDTVYGLCARPDDEQAVAAVQRLKGRPAAQPIALVAAGIDALLELVPELSGRSEAIVRAVLPGQLTLVLPNPAQRLPWLSAARPGTIGIRIPELPAPTVEVVAAVGAVAATSANATGELDPARVDHIPGDIRAACAAVIDIGELPGTASTVIDFTGDEPRVLREGAVPSAPIIRHAEEALT